MTGAWDESPADLTLPQGEVHVWLAALDLDDDERAGLEQTLDSEERARVARYHRPRDRDRCVARRGILRQLLARYLGTDPRTLRFATGTHGKPELADGGRGAGVTFNLSDSDGLALYAVARNRLVGVDLERIVPRSANEEIAVRFFSPREVAALRALPAEQQAAAFFACWARKEAYIKARGEGLSLPLHGFDVSLTPGERPALLAVRGHACEVLLWSMAELPPIPSFAAALCVEGRDWRLRCWNHLNHALGQWHEDGRTSDACLTC